MNALWRRILELFRPAQLDREAVEELSHHVELLVERKMSAGLEPIEARRQALAEVGTVASAREFLAEGRSRVALDQLGREVRYAASSCDRCPIPRPIASFAFSTPIRRLASSAPAWPSATSMTGGRWPAPSTASWGIT